MSELRWNSLLGEWTVTATHRQDRTFFPPPGYCPLCPTAPGGFPTEVSEPTYDIVVFETKRLCTGSAESFSFIKL